MKKYYYLNEKEKISEIIENLEKSIEEFDLLIEMYAKGERPSEDESYTEKNAEQNRSNNFKDNIQEMENKNKELSSNLAKLHDLAKRCEKIPFLGKKVSKAINEQTTLLQEGKTEPIEEDENNMDYLYNKYMSLKETHNRHKEAFLNLKTTVIKCAKIPFIGRGILKEMNEMLEEKNNDLEQR